MADDNDYPNVGNYEDLRARLFASRAEIFDRYGELFIREPRLVEVVNDQVRDTLATIERAYRSRTDAPADGGLLSLVGLGADGTDGFSNVRRAPPLPPYEEQVTSERVIGAADLYYIYQHERLGLFRAVIKLQELFKAGRIKLSDGQGALALYQFDRQKVLRYTRKERLQAYRRVFGYTEAALPTEARPNDMFHRLFTNFNAMVAQYFRDKRISDVIQSGAGNMTFGSIAVVRRAGLDLRNNLKTATYGNVNVLRLEVMQLLERAFEILTAPDVRRLYGADDAWDVLGDVLRRELGERPLTSQRSRMAQTGQEVLNWIARSDVLAASRPDFESLLSYIRDAAEEWLTSAESVGMRSEPRVGRGKIVPFKGRNAVMKGT